MSAVTPSPPSPQPHHLEGSLSSLAQHDEARPMRRADFNRVGVCGAALLLHGLFLVTFGCLELITPCVRVRLGLSLLVGLGDLGQGCLCLILSCLQPPLHPAGRAQRLALWLGAALLGLTALYVICFYAVVLDSSSLAACSSTLQLLLGAPSITSLVVGVPATFLPLAIVWSHSKAAAAAGSNDRSTVGSRVATGITGLA